MNPEDMNTGELSAAQMERPSARIGGVTWRTLVSDDASDLFGLVERIEEADNPPYRTTIGEITSWLSDTTVWRGMLAVASAGPHAGRLIGYAQVAIFPGVTGECLLTGGVDPEYRERGIGGALLAWQTGQGRALHSLTRPDAEGYLVTSIDPEQVRFEAHLQREGYEWTRSTYELRRKLKHLPKIPDIGSYHKIMPWTPELDDQAWRMYNKLLERDQHRYHSRKEWLEQRECFVPEWSFVAVSHTGDRPQVKGFIIVGAYEQDWEVLGWKEGYIDRLGVSDDSPTTDLSRALVIASMRAQKDADMNRVATGVGAPANGQALNFYLDLGFKQSFETRTYALKI